jgi:hypothetical protein
VAIGCAENETLGCTVVRSTEVAVAYVIVGLSYLGIFAILLSASLVGSLQHLWQKGGAQPSAFLPLLLAMLINFAIAGIIYRYEQRSRTVQLLGVAVALGLFAVACDDVIEVFRLSQSARASAGLGHEVWPHLIYVLMYGWLAFEVVRMARASNHRAATGQLHP